MLDAKKNIEQKQIRFFKMLPLTPITSIISPFKSLFKLTPLSWNAVDR